MYWDIIKIKVRSTLILEVTFQDGTQGVIRFLPESLKGVFESLKDPEYFAKVKLSKGVPTWPDEIDLAPDAAYHEIKEHGEWLIAS